MKGGDGGWVQGYNAQAAVDRDQQVIVACDLTPKRRMRRICRR